jgi:hypothetical protein
MVGTEISLRTRTRSGTVAGFKKALAVVVALAVAASGMAACGKSQSQKNQENRSKTKGGHIQ